MTNQVGANHNAHASHTYRHRSVPPRSNRASSCSGLKQSALEIYLKQVDSSLAMKQLLLTTIAAVVVVGCGE